ncbi:MAG TPA: M42 family metallopeptidase [Anaerolineaceae bacterium]|nr:M42 family metallopeptidase [Anaerolineaceae bacterium]
MKELIQKLVETTAPSGYETAVRDLVRREIEPLADEITVDALGNLIARKGSKAGNGLRIMLDAHMDEIGVIVTHVDENGFVRFTTIGGVYARMLIGGRVKFLDGTPGVIGGEQLESNDKVHPFDRLFIDVGATSRADCPVKVGDIAAFDRPFVDMGDRMVAKAMDDRIAVAVLIEVMRRLSDGPNEIYFVFSTQEEVGPRGAVTAAYSIDPDLGIAVDVTMTGDTPKARRMDVSLGKGPAIKVRDAGMLADPRIVRWMADTAERLEIPFQLEILEGGTTDARAIQLTRAGVPSGCVSIPCRYVHSPSEMVDRQDVENTVRLVTEILCNPIELK